MKVLVMEPFDGIETQFDRFREAGHELMIGPYVSETDKKYSNEQIVKFGNEFDAILGLGREKLTRPLIEQFERVRVLGKCGAGYDHIDVAAATDKGIIVVTTPGVNSIEVAEFAVSMMLALLKKIPYSDRSFRNLHWRGNDTIGSGLYEKTVGIVGFGAIGKGVARRLQGWGCRLLAYDPFVKQENVKDMDVTMTDWDTVFKESDVITLHMPCTAQTKDSVGRREFEMMKKSAVIVNTARGKIIHEPDLIWALKNREIAGAGLDVHYTEPATMAYPMLSMYENVILTPHLGGYAYPAMARMTDKMGVYINRILQGDVPNEIVNPEVLPLWKKRFGYK